LPDVLRLAVPPRHAEAEKAQPGEPVPTPDRPDHGPWSRYVAGPTFLDRLAAGDPVRAAWTALPSAGDPTSDWPRAVAVAVLSTLSGGRGALVVVPDARDVARIEDQLRALGGNGQPVHVALTADLGPKARYAAWLRVSRGEVRAVVGTRAAMFAPVRDLGLVVCWDDGDDLHAEPHAPYPHVRDVLVLRAELENSAALFGSFTRTAEAQHLVDRGWARPVAGDRAAVRSAAPRVLLAGEGPEPERDPAAASARLPSVAWRTAQRALADGPVLVQVPRRGYVPAVACLSCRTPARCPHCHGPLALTAGGGPPTCRWCGRVAAAWACPECGNSRLRSLVVGARRTAEELGRAFPGVPVRTSGGGTVLSGVGPEPALVVATPGAEPVAEGGYAAALLLDAWALLDRADLRAGEEALRRWLRAGALVRGSASGGRVVLVAPSGLLPVEALVRWAPEWHAGQELSARRELGFPPARTVVTLTGPSASVEGLRRAIDLPADVELLGPVPMDVPGGPAPRVVGEAELQVRVLLRSEPARALDLARAVRAGVSVRSARKERGSVRVQVDPLDLI
jgi:primosomal protein N' (replication factor Y)